MILEPGELEETLGDKRRYHIKGRCASCNVKIPKSWDHYQVYGNFCRTCTNRIHRQCEASLERRISQEKAADLLKKRREGVRAGIILH